MKLGIPPFRGTSALSGDAARSAREMEQVVRQDLQNSGYFEIQGPEAFQRLQLTGDLTRDLEAYRTTGIETLLLGDVRAETDKLVFEGRLFDISSGGLVAHQKIVAGPGYQVPLAAHVRRETGLRVSAVGAITEGAQAEEILQQGDADAIFAAREWLRDPHFGLRAAVELGEGTDLWPAQYARAARR